MLQWDIASLNKIFTFFFFLDELELVTIYSRTSVFHLSMLKWCAFFIFCNVSVKKEGCRLNTVSLNVYWGYDFTMYTRKTVFIHVVICNKWGFKSPENVKVCVISSFLHGTPIHITELLCAMAKKVVVKHCNASIYEHC